MTLVIRRSTLNSLSFDFDEELSNYTQARQAHALTINAPAPTTHPLVEQAFLAGGYQVDEDVEEVPPPEPGPPTLEDYRTAIQAHVDATARERQYDSGVSCASYVNSTVQQWAAEAAAFVAWRDAVWAHAFTELDKVLNEERPQPTVEEFLLELPAM